jgi:hypothetical protein
MFARFRPINFELYIRFFDGWFAVRKIKGRRKPKEKDEKEPPAEKLPRDPGNSNKKVLVDSIIPNTFFIINDLKRSVNY